MTILSDRQIRARCLIPTHSNTDSFELRFFTQYEDKLYDSGTGETVQLCSEKFKELSDVKKVDFDKRMIDPFVPYQIKERDEGLGKERIISYGTSSMGYDVRLGRKFKIFTNLFNALIDPLNMPENSYVDHEGDCVVIPPNSYVLGHTVEYFRMPRNIAAICVGKSTYARAGCAINVTPIEPGFEGNVVIEIANQTPLPMKVYSGMGIAQFVFFKGETCETCYADRSGKYQGQTGIQTALV